MKIEFFSAETGDVVFTKDSEDLKDALSTITRPGTEIRLVFSKDETVFGYVQNVMYRIDVENESECLRIYFTENFGKSKGHFKVSPEKIEAAKLNEKNPIGQIENK